VFAPVNPGVVAIHQGRGVRNVGNDEKTVIENSTLPSRASLVRHVIKKREKAVCLKGPKGGKDWAKKIGPVQGITLTNEIVRFANLLVSLDRRVKKGRGTNPAKKEQDRKKERRSRKTA